MNYGKTSGNEVFTRYEIRLTKTDTKEVLVVTIEEQLNFNEHIINICLYACRGVNIVSAFAIFNLKI